MADGSPFDADRDAQEAGHGWMPRRKADAARVGGDAIDTHRLAVSDHHAEESESAWLPAHRAPLIVTDPTGDETLEVAVVIEDAERGIAGIDEWAHALDDDLQDSLKGQLLGDRDGRRIEGLEASACVMSRRRPFLRVADGVGQLPGRGCDGRVCGVGRCAGFHLHAIYQPSGDQWPLSSVPTALR